MNLFKKKTPAVKYFIEPSDYPSRYSLKKWDTYLGRYMHEKSLTIESTEEIENIIAFYSQPVVYF